MKNKSSWILASFLCFTLLCLNFVYTHFDKIMSAKANYYFKNNNIPKAQEYFEKSFDLGSKDEKDRELSAL